MSEQKKNKLISAGSTTVIMMLLLLFMLFCGFTYQNPPPQAKKVIMIELDEEYGGGNHQKGGSKGNTAAPSATNANAASQPASAPNYVTDSKASVSTNASTVKTPVPQQPQVNSNALFKGSQNGSTAGSGNGLGRGNGLGQGDDSGNGMGAGRGIGYGNGTRPFRRTPDLELPVSESGQVSVEVEIAANGQVINAKIINTKNYPTTVTKASVQQECLNKAKKISYREGEHELRIIVFK